MFLLFSYPITKPFSKRNNIILCISIIIILIAIIIYTYNTDARQCVIKESLYFNPEGQCQGRYFQLNDIVNTPNTSPFSYKILSVMQNEPYQSEALSCYFSTDDQLPVYIGNPDYFKWPNGTINCFYGARRSLFSFDMLSTQGHDDLFGYYDGCPPYYPYATTNTCYAEPSLQCGYGASADTRIGRFEIHLNPCKACTEVTINRTDKISLLRDVCPEYTAPTPIPGVVANLSTAPYSYNYTKKFLASIFDDLNNSNISTTYQCTDCSQLKSPLDILVRTMVNFFAIVGAAYTIISFILSRFQEYNQIQDPEK